MVLETPAEKPKEEATVPSTAAPSFASPETPTVAVETQLTKELAKLKAEQARLREIEASFTISHVIPAEELSQDTGDSQSHELSEVSQDPEENHIEQSNNPQTQDTSLPVDGIEQEAEEDGAQEQRDLEMETVD